jgi:hypothetical protein
VRRRGSQKGPKSANALCGSDRHHARPVGRSTVLDIAATIRAGSDRSMKTWGRWSRNSAAEWSLYGSPGEHRGRGVKMSRPWPPVSVSPSFFSRREIK